ncbi:NUDIX hydrolase domain-like protein [Limtongia smithiae]|uniref:NUDIX hydrolase domain-like protein n=1 Tax=Limtongia smithiae TaxID=1125753 RepID=UPI0034CD753A
MSLASSAAAPEVGVSMVAREGREKQRYASSGARLVAGVVALSADKTRVLLITSTASATKFVLPKGGFETDEPTAQHAAMREAWEEAGVLGSIGRELGVIDDPRPARLYSPTVPRAEYHFFEMHVEKEAERWPECDKRTRLWASYAEAARLLCRPELVEALNRSSIAKD